MRADEFVRELAPLHAFRSEYMGTSLLEGLESASLLFPRIRLRYPDPVARRLWLEMHEDMPCQLKHPLEPDGARWDSAVDFRNRLHRWQNYIVYGISPHPLDDYEPRFTEFVQRPKDFSFERRLDRRVDVSSDVYETLFDDCNVEDYYSSWQLLFAAELADAGIHMRINLADRNIARAAEKAIHQGRIPAGTSSAFNFLPAHAARNFASHEKALDAVVWFAEERSRMLSKITTQHGGGRFRLSPAEGAQYEQAGQDLALASAKRFSIGGNDLETLIRFLAEYWSNWDHEGRPRIADSYKAFLASAVILMRRVEDLTFAELRDRIGRLGGGFKPILDVIWPNWAEEEKERARLTLKSAMRSDRNTGFFVSEADIGAFVHFLASEGLEAFFWRLKSFENHDLRGNEFAIEGMQSDIQGMAIAVEHVAVTLGGTATQLLEKFKQLWRDPDVLRILKRGDVAPLARTARLAQDWSALKAKINALRSEPGGQVAADLAMAHRIRGGVHAVLPEDDHFELEALFIGLMRAALLTFVEVRRNDPALKKDPEDIPVD